MAFYVFVAFYLWVLIDRVLNVYFVCNYVTKIEIRRHLSWFPKWKCPSSAADNIFSLLWNISRSRQRKTKKDTKSIDVGLSLRDSWVYQTYQLNQLRWRRTSRRDIMCKRSIICWWNIIYFVSVKFNCGYCYRFYSQICLKCCVNLSQLCVAVCLFYWAKDKSLLKDLATYVAFNEF